MGAHFAKPRCFFCIQRPELREQIAAKSWRDERSGFWRFGVAKLHSDEGSASRKGMEGCGPADEGTVVGAATNQGDQNLLAFRWKDHVMANLGPLTGDAGSVSDAINTSGQVVGGSGIFEAASFPACTDLVEHAFLWEEGRMIDLNNFVPDNSDITLNEAVFINEAGEISGFGTFPNGTQHAVLLIPCDEAHPDIESCDYSLVDLPSAVKVGPANTAARAKSQGNMSSANMMLRYRSLPGNQRRRFARPSSK